MKDHPVPHELDPASDAFDRLRDTFLNHTDDLPDDVDDGLNAILSRPDDLLALMVERGVLVQIGWRDPNETRSNQFYVNHAPWRRPVYLLTGGPDGE